MTIHVEQYKKTRIPPELSKLLEATHQQYSMPLEIKIDDTTVILQRIDNRKEEENDM